MTKPIEVLSLLNLFKLLFLRIQIKRYYSFKVKHHDMYYGLMPSKEENIFKANVLTVFPNRDQLGRRILLLELGSELECLYLVL